MFCCAKDGWVPAGPVAMRSLAQGPTGAFLLVDQIVYTSLDLIVLYVDYKGIFLLL